jgi:hypothetical protein
MEKIPERKIVFETRRKRTNDHSDLKIHFLSEPEYFSEKDTRAVLQMQGPYSKVF